jgi:hypothetical protein
MSQRADSPLAYQDPPFVLRINLIVNEAGIREVRWLGPPRELAWSEIARAAVPINTNYLLQGASGKPAFLIVASWSHVERPLKFVGPDPFWTDRMSPAGMALQAVKSSCVPVSAPKRLKYPSGDDVSDARKSLRRRPTLWPIRTVRHARDAVH